MEYLEKHKEGLPHAGGRADGSITPLHCAAWTSDQNSAKSFLVDQNTRRVFNNYTIADTDAELYGELPVHYAARRGDEAMLELLRANGDDLAARVKNGKGELCGPTVLHFAVVSGMPGAVRAVLKALLSLEREAADALHAGDGIPPELIKAYLEQHPDDPRDVCDFYEGNPALLGLTPLQVAVNLALDAEYPGWWGKRPSREPRGIDRMQIVKLLLEVPGIKPDRCCGPSPLWLAVRRGNVELVDMLLAKGANPMLSFWAVECIHKKAAEMDAEGEDRLEGLCPLCLALRKGDQGMLERLLPYADLDTPSSKRGGSSPLYEAVATGIVDFVKLLLDKGADPGSQGSVDAWRGGGHLRLREDNEQEARDRDRLEEGQRTWSPLILAASKGLTEIAEILIDALRNRYDRADELVQEQEALLNKMDYMQAQDRYDRENQRLYKYKWLAEQKANGEDYGINYAERENGYTALHLAAGEGFAKTVKLLLCKGAHVNKRSMELPLGGGGETALHLALRSLQAVREKIGKQVRGRLITTAKLLLQAGADVNAEDAEGVTPRQLAAECCPEVRLQLGRACGALLD